MVPDTALPFRKALPWVGYITLLFWFVYCARSLLAPLLVAIETDFGVGHATATTLLLMQSLGFSTSLLICGFTLSRIRAAHVVVFALVGSGVTFVLMPLVSTFGQAQLLFVFFGLAAGTYFPAAMTTLSSLTRTEDWGKTVGVHELAPQVSFMFIPVLAQWGLTYTDWQGVFAVLGWFMIAMGISFLIWGRGGHSYAPPPSFKGCKQLFLSPAAWAVVAVMTIAMVGEFSIFSILQLYLVDVLNFTPATANHVAALTRLASPVAVLVGGYVADRFNPLMLVRVFLVMHAVALGLMFIDSPIPALTGTVMQGATVALLFPALFKVLAISFPMGMQPILLSLSMPVGGLVSVGMVPVFLGWCGQYASFGVGFLTLAAISLLCLFAVSAMANSEK